MTIVEPTLKRYGEPLLRKIATRLIRPRNQWSADDLRDKLVDALDDAVIVDRALRALPGSCRRLLKLVHVSGQSQWRVRALTEMDDLLGGTEGVSPVAELLESGLAFPILASNGLVADLNNWLALGVDTPLEVSIPPNVAARCQSESLQIELTPFGETTPPQAIRESDGWEWPLRVAVVWQLLRSGPIRLAQHGGLFKRDWDRLSGHPILNSKPADELCELPDRGRLALDLAERLGVAVRQDDEIIAGPVDGLAGEVLSNLHSALSRLDHWDVVEGNVPVPPERTAAALILTALLAEQKAGQWYRLSHLAQWLQSRVPPESRFNADQWTRQLFIGLLHQWRLVQTAQINDDWIVRLSPAGRAAVNREPPIPTQTLDQTLLVQPNHEIILYRQGLTPTLIAALTPFAEWKSLGLACTLTMTADSVYRGLECGQSALDIQRTLERHGTRSVPDTVAESLKSWSSKRERVQVFPSAVILEFKQPAELQKAVQMGLVDLAITDKLGLVAREDRLEYQQFRLIGSRDYMAAEEVCVEVGPDGLSLTVIDGRSDLLLEPELSRLAEAIPDGGYQLTWDSLQSAKLAGWDMRQLADWFIRRTGAGPTAAARLLFEGANQAQSSIESMIVLRLLDEEVADGLATWPESTRLLGERISDTMFAVPEGNVEAVKELLAKLGIQAQ